MLELVDMSGTWELGFGTLCEVALSVQHSMDTIRTRQV